jgi:hypothetical protein
VTDRFDKKKPLQVPNSVALPHKSVAQEQQSNDGKPVSTNRQRAALLLNKDSVDQPYLLSTQMAERSRLPTGKPEPSTEQVVSVEGVKPKPN